MRYPNRPQSTNFLARARRASGAGVFMLALASFSLSAGYAGEPSAAPQAVPAGPGPVSFSVNGVADPQMDGLAAPGNGLFYPPWCPGLVPPGSGPFPFMRMAVQVPKARGIASSVGDVNAYWAMGPMLPAPPSEQEVFQSEPWSSLVGGPAGPPAGTNNQILKAVAMGLDPEFANMNAYTFGEDYFTGAEDPVSGALDLFPEPWGGRDVAPGFVEPFVATGELPIIFHFGVDSYAIGLQTTAVQDEATLHGALTLPAGPAGSADVGFGGGPWLSYGEAAGDVFWAEPVLIAGMNFLQYDEAAMALLAPFVPVAPPYWATMEDDLDALEDVGTNTLFDGTPAETGNTHDRVAPTSGVNGGSDPPDLGDPNNPNHDPINGNPIIFSVDRASGGTPGSAAHSQVMNCSDGASGDLFIAVTIPPPSLYAGMTTNMLLIDEGQLGLMPYDDLDAVIVRLLIPVGDLVVRIEAASDLFTPEPVTYNEGPGFTLPLLGPGEAVVGFSVDNASIGLLFSAVDFECRVDGMGLSGAGYSGSGVMEQGGDIFFSILVPPPSQTQTDAGTGLPFGQNYLWFEELAIGLDRGNWQLTGVTGDLSLSPDELNALDSYEESGGCITDDDCRDFDACTCDRCIAGSCSNLDRKYGDVNCDGTPNVFDIFCILDVLGGTPPAGCNQSNADIEPCAGNATLNVFDMFEVLAAIAGDNNCNCPAGPP